MADKRTASRVDDPKALEPQFLEKFDVPMGAIQEVPMDSKFPFHVKAFTQAGSIHIGSYPRIEDARMRLLDYAATVVDLLVKSPEFSTVVELFKADYESAGN
jgi:hypothetical protein